MVARLVSRLVARRPLRIVSDAAIESILKQRAQPARECGIVEIGAEQLVDPPFARRLQR